MNLNLKSPTQLLSKAWLMLNSSAVKSVFLKAREEEIEKHDALMDDIDAFIKNQKPYRQKDTSVMLHINLPAYIPDYESPESTAEWRWIFEVSSFNHVEHGELGICEVIVNLDSFNESSQLLSRAPDVLKEIIKQAREASYSYILFHQ